jgi:hypothetical protein
LRKEAAAGEYVVRICGTVTAQPFYLTSGTPYLVPADDLDCSR